MNIFIIYYILDNILYKKVKVNMTLKDFSQLTMLNSNINSFIDAYNHKKSKTINSSELHP